MLWAYNNSLGCRHVLYCIQLLFTYFFSYTSLNDAVSQAIRRRMIRLVHNKIQSFFTDKDVATIKITTSNYTSPTPSVKIILNLGFFYQRVR